MSKKYLIAAIADNYAIGKNNKLIWHLPADLHHFKTLTTGHAIVMGKRTFESLPNGALPDRKNIVLTTVLEGNYEKYYEATSIDDALFLCEHEEKVFFIGGEKIFTQVLDRVDEMYITWVHSEFEADTFFPKIDFDQWNEVSREAYEADEKNPYPYTFSHYERKK